MKYTVSNLRSDFPDEQACLRCLLEWVYPDGITCSRCDRVITHYPVRGRKTFACGSCGKQVSPTAGTIFHKSSTPLTLWFHAFYMLSTNKGGVSAAQLQREIGVTYKTAFRMLHKIRELMQPPEETFTGEVELDETFIHANVWKRSSAQRRYGLTGSRRGEVIFGILERETGRVKAFHVKTAGERVLTPIIRKHVQVPALIHSDGYIAYRKLPVWGYDHLWTDHGKKQFYTEVSSTQRIENFWSTWKPRMKGTYKNVSSKYLQAYANEYAWRYSNRNKPSMFLSLLSRIERT